MYVKCIKHTFTFTTRVFGLFFVHVRERISHDRHFIFCLCLQPPRFSRLFTGYFASLDQTIKSVIS